MDIASLSIDEAITSEEEAAFGWGLYVKQVATLLEEAHSMGAPDLTLPPDRNVSA